MAKFIWLASYPRSGNTWVRFLIATLLRGPITSSREVVAQIPDIHEGIGGAHFTARGTTLIKTHWKFWTAMPLREDTVGAIYIIRNPIDVLESNQNHALLRSGDFRSAKRPEEIQAAARKVVDLFIDRDGHPNFKEFGIGSWTEHVESWTWPGISMPRLILRYEDILLDPAGKLAEVAKFIGASKSDSDIRSAAEACSKDKMRLLEEQEIKSKPNGLFFQPNNAVNLDAGQRFVGRGVNGHDQFHLTDDQRDRAIRRFGGTMVKFGYPVPGRGAQIHPLNP